MIQYEVQIEIKALKTQNAKIFLLSGASEGALDDWKEVEAGKAV